MKRERCPHCGEIGFYTGNLPNEVVAVMACRRCQELSVLFRNTIIPIKRQILESGSFDERKEHLAEVIAKFLEAGLFSFEPQEAISESVMENSKTKLKRLRQRDENGSTPITDQELEHFVHVDLKSLDNPTYFKRIFG